MYVETADDLNRKYGQTYALLNGELIYIIEAYQDGKNIVLTHHKNDGSQKEVQSIIVPDDIEPIAIDAMYVNNIDFSKVKKDNTTIPATLFRRSPKRQWKRGLGHDNTHLLCPAANLYKSLHKTLKGFNHSLSFPLIERLMSPTYPSYPEAIKLCDKFIAVAISPQFAVTLSSISQDKYLVASTHGFIGEGDSKHVWIRHQPSEQEMSDYIRRTNQPIGLEVGPCP